MNHGSQKLHKKLFEVPQVSWNLYNVVVRLTLDMTSAHGCRPEVLTCLEPSPGDPATVATGSAATVLRIGWGE